MRHFFRTRAFVAGGAALACLVAASTARAAVVVLSRENQISVQGQGGDGLDADFLTTDALLVGLEPFSATLEDSATGQVQLDDGSVVPSSAAARARQVARFGPTPGGGFEAFFEAESAAEVSPGVLLTVSANATNDSRLNFEVTGQPMAFRIDVTVDNSIGMQTGLGLRDLGGALNPYDISIPSDVPFATEETKTGTLNPGQYALEALLTASPEAASEFGAPATLQESGSYSIRLTLTPIDDGGGPTPIPLPPAVWPGAAMLAACGAWTVAAKRLQRR